MKQHAVIIVGAGPAGSSLALALVRRGIVPASIVLLDSRRLAYPLPAAASSGQLLPGKVCGDAIAARTLATLGRLGLAEFAGAYRAAGVRIAAPNGIAVQGRFKQPDLVLERASFDGQIAAAARAAGVLLLDGWRVKGVERVASGWQVVANDQQASSHNLGATLLIGADGATSLVARAAMGVSERPGLSVAVRGYLNPADVLGGDNGLELDFLSTASGYGWYFPLAGAQAANVGIGTTATALKAAGANLRAMLADYMAGLAARGRVRQGATLQQVASWQLPMSGKVGTVVGDHALLIGDAAGLVSPLTGAGIENAVDSAILAADAVALALRQPARTAAAWAGYERRLQQMVGGHLRRDLLLRRVGDNQTAFRLFGQLCRRFPGLMQGLIYAFK